ncbi:ion channel [Nocardioides terrisoli]|uniref:ion channel n=1 Tax=Nocardioides terrisoli TaxID=3388267 RepID=UPI00287B71AF|nr:ion channel [Nocardioides marmorisolisilvae]
MSRTQNPLTQRLERHPSAALLLAQLLAVVLSPFFGDHGAGKAVLGVVSTLVVGTALYAVRRTPALTVVALCLGVPAILFVVLEAIHPHSDWIVLTNALLHAPFYFFVSYGLIRYLYDDDRVSTDELYAVGAAFTVVAWGFAYLYVAVQVVWPGSFSGPGPGPYSWFVLLFLSFSNLTSCGLSDVLPALGQARAVMIIEQVTGVLYIGMVISRLVGLAVRRSQVP